MDIGNIEGATRVIGASQGYHGLPLRDELVNCAVNGPETPCMSTDWVPSEEDIATLVAGGKIRLRVLGTVHPPVMIEAVAK